MPHTPAIPEIGSILLLAAPSLAAVDALRQTPTAPFAEHPRGSLLGFLGCGNEAGDDSSPYRVIGGLDRLKQTIEELHPDRISALNDCANRLPFDGSLRFRAKGLAVEDGIKAPQRLLHNRKPHSGRPGFPRSSEPISSLPRTEAGHEYSGRGDGAGTQLSTEDLDPSADSTGLQRADLFHAAREGV
jgi:hypothetical protein